ncbi:hypothetical protein LMG33818_002027 [Halomonadaceae bacterium LMG 33818]
MAGPRWLFIQPAPTIAILYIMTEIYLAQITFIDNSFGLMKIIVHS